MDAFYASVECLYNPKLKGHPVAVAGDPEKRHGIILAKTQAAKACGVATGNPIWLAKQLCPEIILVPPHYGRYLKHARLAKEIYKEYTNQVETLGLDECWLDVTGSIKLYGDGKTIAQKVQNRIYEELGITASIGVSWNKMFSKLGSDYHKPNGITVFERGHMEPVIWKLPVNDLWGIGRATAPKLAKYGIWSIGQLATVDKKFLQQKFGKVGLMLWGFANGMDSSPVLEANDMRPIKSIGNTTTAPRDLETVDDVKITLLLLAESVAERLRDQKFQCRTIQVWIRFADMGGCERQATLLYPISNSDDIYQLAFGLLKDNWPAGKKIRGLGVRGCNLTGNQCVQQSFDLTQIASQRKDDLEITIDNIRSRFGHFIVQRGLQLTDQNLSNVDPKNDHIGFMQI